MGRSKYYKPAKEMYDQGMNCYEIADVLGCSYQNIRYLLGLVQERPDTKKRNENILIDYNNGMNIIELTNKYNITRISIMKILQDFEKAGVEVKRRYNNQKFAASLIYGLDITTVVPRKKYVPQKIKVRIKGETTGKYHEKEYIDDTDFWTYRTDYIW